MNSMGALQWLSQGDAVTQASALLLLAMSVASWVVIGWKLRLLRRARRDVLRCTSAFWQAPDLDTARQQFTAFDREALLLPLLDAAHAVAHPAAHPGATPARLAHAGSLAQQLTRVLRDALHRALGTLQAGQVLLATVGSTAPFVGLLGTVWASTMRLPPLRAPGRSASTSWPARWARRW